MDKYNIIIEKVFNANGRIHHYALNEQWYVNNNIIDIFYSILNATDFLDEYNVSFRERLYYIWNKYDSVKLCPYCETRRLKYKTNTVNLTKTCGNSKCLSKLSSINVNIMMDGWSKTDWDRIREKISMKNSGKKRTPEQRKRISDGHVGITQSDETKRKRHISRKNNGNEWHTEDTKLRISKTNKKTWNTPKYKKLRIELTNQNKIKQSITMKEKIRRGEFTPCITNSWTNWKAYIIENGVEKKFRSSWEAVFYLVMGNLKYEKTRIPYTYNDTKHVYMVDFTDESNRILYEVKPNSEKYSKRNLLKYKYALEWCNVNNYRYVVVGDGWFKQNAINVDYLTHPQLKFPMEQFL